MQDACLESQGGSVSIRKTCTSPKIMPVTPIMKVTRPDPPYMSPTWTPKVCKIIAFMSVIMGLRLLFYILFRGVSVSPNNTVVPMSGPFLELKTLDPKP